MAAPPWLPLTHTDRSVKMKTKTPLRKPFLKTLEGLNDQLCYFLFSSHEFSSRLGRFSDAAKQLYTTDLYAKNPYSRSIHVRVAKLDAFVDEIERSTLATYVSATYEAVSQYISDVGTLLTTTNAPTFKMLTQKGLGPEDNLQRSLIKAGYASLHVLDVATLTYFRLRRNHIIHRASKTTPKLRQFITNAGGLLNKYWAGTVAQLDFSDTDILRFEERTCIDALKVLRIVLLRIDAHVSGLVDIGSLADVTAEQLFGSKRQKINADVVRSRSKTLETKIRSEYGIPVPHGVLQKAVRKHGVK